MHKVVVTGSSGFVASHLIPALVARGCEVIGMDILPPRGVMPEGFRHFDADIRDASKVADICNGADTIVHLAAEHKDFGVSPEEYYSVNVEGTSVLLDGAEKTGVCQFVFYSSVAVYGDLECGSREDIRPDPTSEYGRTKLLAEQCVKDWAAKRRENRSIVLRPTVIYGEQNTANMYRLIDSIRRGRYFHIGRGDNKKSIVYIGNVVDATFFLLDRDDSTNTVFNLADSPAWTSREIAEAIAANLGCRIRSFPLPVKVGLALAKPIDWSAKATGIDFPITSARIKKYLSDTIHHSDKIAAAGFRPKYDQRDGIRRMVDWFLSRDR